MNRAGRIPATLDHLVLATPDLAATAQEFAARTGVTPAPGGSHTGWGTANVLVGLGGGTYLEIVGPDLDQPVPEAPRPFGIDDLDAARLVTWAVRPTDLEATLTASRRAGYDPGPAVPMSRRTVDGESLHWRLTPSRGVVPFLIDWGSTPHPTTRDLPAVTLQEFTLQHPDPVLLRQRLVALGVTAPVEPGPEPALRAVLGTPRGPITL